MYITLFAGSKTFAKHLRLSVRLVTLRASGTSVVCQTMASDHDCGGYETRPFLVLHIILVLLIQNNSYMHSLTRHHH
jgi:hypothetical protein